jgi:Ala-tRNA(Pro) deacylase
VRFELVEHEPTTTAAEEALTTHRPTEQVAKTIVLQDEAGYALAVIPASERLDLGKVRTLLGAGRRLRLATEEEIARDISALEVGAAAPLGPAMPIAEVVDQRLLEEPRIFCAGGDHRHSVVLDPRDVVRLTGAVVADICVVG